MRDPCTLKSHCYNVRVLMWMPCLVFLNSFAVKPLNKNRDACVYQIQYIPIEIFNNKVHIIPLSFTKPLFLRTQISFTT